MSQLGLPLQPKTLDIKDLFFSLIECGWLTRIEADTFLADLNLIRAMEESTSPVPENIFNALNLVPYDKVKVLILGQDPYPNPLHAHGLAFSSKNSTTPGSLRNIFKAIDSAYGSKLAETKNNDLTAWANSGVLLLNTALTYKNAFDNSLTAKENKKAQQKTRIFHMTAWKSFINLIITKLLNRKKPLVMLLWGGEAWNIVQNCINEKETVIEHGQNGKEYLPQKNVLILHTDHPSQVKINLGGKFLEHAPIHFKECDKFLGEDAVCWTNL